MAKFCKYCGSPLEEGQVCSCPQAQAAAQQSAPEQGAPQQSAPEQGAPQQGYVPPQQGNAPPQQGYVPPQQQGYQQPYAQAAPAAPSPVGLAFKNLLPFIKAYFRSPIQAAQAALGQRDMVLSLILLIIQAIVGGLVMFSFMAKLCGLADDVIQMVSGVGSMLGGYSGFDMPSVSASFLFCLIFGLLSAAIAIVVFILLVFAVAKIMKSACTLKDVVIACGAHSIFVTVLLLADFILMFLSIRLGLAVFLFAMVAWIVMGVPTGQAVSPNSEQGKLWMLYIVAVLVALLVGSFCASKFFGMSLMETSISAAGQEFTIGEALEQAGMLDFDDLMEQAIYELF